jgi:hypothetical protein
MAERVTNRSASACGRMAKILAWTLRRGMAAEPAKPGGLTPLRALQGFGTLLQHYYHASNSGKCAPSACSLPCESGWSRFAACQALHRALGRCAARASAPAPHARGAPAAAGATTSQTSSPASAASCTWTASAAAQNPSSAAHAMPCSTPPPLGPPTTSRMTSRPQASTTRAPTSRRRRSRRCSASRPSSQSAASASPSSAYTRASSRTTRCTRLTRRSTSWRVRTTVLCCHTRVSARPGRQAEWQGCYMQCQTAGRKA